LAIEYKKEPQSMHYFFKLLTNINGKSYIDDYVLYQLYKGYLDIAKENDQKITGFNFKDICDEIYDLVKPAQEGKITLSEMIDSHADIIQVFVEFWDSREGITEIADIQETNVWLESAETNLTLYTLFLYWHIFIARVFPIVISKSQT